MTVAFDFRTHVYHCTTCGSRDQACYRSERSHADDAQGPYCVLCGIDGCKTQCIALDDLPRGVRIGAVCLGDVIKIASVCQVVGQVDGNRWILRGSNGKDGPFTSGFDLGVMLLRRGVPT